MIASRAAASLSTRPSAAVATAAVSAAAIATATPASASTKPIAQRAPLRPTPGNAGTRFSVAPCVASAISGSYRAPARRIRLVPSGRRCYSTEAGPDPVIYEQYDQKTGSWQYVVANPHTHHAIIIDPVLDYDAATGTISTDNADKLLAHIQAQGYHIDMILETHAHADHMTAASYLQKTLTQSQSGEKPLIGIGRRIGQVQKLFGDRYGISPAEYEGVFDRLLDDDEQFEAAGMKAVAIHIPGHTPDHMGYKIGDNVFVGDSIFNVDLGSARADFPGGSADSLFASGRKLLQFPDHTKIWVGHDYPPEGRDAPVSNNTVSDHREQNKHLNASMTEEDFVKMRKQRDATLAEPRLIHPSLQVNIRAGRLPAPIESGQRLLHLPLQLQASQAW